MSDSTAKTDLTLLLNLATKPIDQQQALIDGMREAIARLHIFDAKSRPRLAP